MILGYRNKAWIWRGRFEEKQIPESTGFIWDGKMEAWITRDPAAADRILKLGATPDQDAKIMLRKAAERFQASKATFSSEVLAVPSGEEYLPFQKAGIEFAKPKPGVLIGDEMGLGKTVQALGLINQLPAYRNILIVCPAGLKINWLRESKKWLVNSGLSLRVANSPSSFPTSNIVIINYKILDKYRKDIRARVWDMLIVDECHYLKNPDAGRTKEIFGGKGVGGPLLATRRLFLTGTPLLSKPAELWPLLHSLDPVVWNNWKTFAHRYCDPKMYQINTRFGRKSIWRYEGSTNPKELQARVRSTVMVRRLKSEVLKELPPKRRQIIELGKCNELARWIEKAREILHLRARAAEGYRDAVAGLKDSTTVAFHQMAKSRHDTAMSKVRLVIPFLKNAVASSGKVVCFAYHHDVIDAIAEAFPHSSATLDGRMTDKGKQLAVDRFQQCPDIKLFIGNIHAAGVGHTLTASSHEVFVELDWVPGKVTQAEDRCHRIGQENSVLVQHLVLDGSLDAKMAKALIRKQDQIDQALDTGEFDWVDSLVNEPQTKGVPEMGNLMELFVRFVVAVETLAKMEVERVRLLGTSIDHYVSKTDGKSMPPNVNLTPASGSVPVEQGVIGPEDRDAIKDKLTVMGVAYNNKCQTNTLYKLMQDEEAKAAAGNPLPADGVGSELPAEPSEAPAPSDDDVFGEDAAPPAAEDDFLDDEPAKVYTQDEVRAALVKVKADHGPEKARAILLSAGKVTKLSGVDAANYGALVEACQKA